MWGMGTSSSERDWMLSHQSIMVLLQYMWWCRSSVVISVSWNDHVKSFNSFELHLFSVPLCKRGNKVMGQWHLFRLIDFILKVVASACLMDPNPHSKMPSNYYLCIRQAGTELEALLWLLFLVPEDSGQDDEGERTLMVLPRCGPY